MFLFGLRVCESARGRGVARRLMVREVMQPPATPPAGGGILPHLLNPAIIFLSAYSFPVAELIMQAPRKGHTAMAKMFCRCLSCVPAAAGAFC